MIAPTILFFEGQQIGFRDTDFVPSCFARETVLEEEDRKEVSSNFWNWWVRDLVYDVIPPLNDRAADLISETSLVERMLRGTYH